VPLIYLLRLLFTAAVVAAPCTAAVCTAAPDVGLIGPPCNASTACGIGNGFLGIRSVSVDGFREAWSQ
jgi:hypothetical protein